MKKLAAILLSAALMAGAAAPSAFAGNIKNVEVNGHEVVFRDVEAEIINNNVMIPARFSIEAMGLGFIWNQTTQQAEIKGENFKAVITVGSDEITVSGGDPIKMRTAAVLKNNRMLISEDAIKTIAELNGFHVLSEDVNRSIIITSSGAASATVDGTEVIYSGCAPAIVGGTVMYPARYVTEAMGLNFAWEPGTGAVISGFGRDAVLKMNSREIELSGETYIADTNVLLNGSRVYASAKVLKLLAEYFGGTAEINGSTIAITTPVPYTVIVDGKALAFDGIPPMLRDGVRLIPLRDICDKAGLHYTKQGEYAKISNAKESKYVLLHIGAEEYKEYTLNAVSGTQELDQPISGTADNVIVSLNTLVTLGEFLELDITVDGDNRLMIGAAVNNSGIANDNKPNDNKPNDNKPNDNAPEEEPITVTYNGAKVSFPDAQCIIKDGRTLIPVRAVTEAMNMEVQWDGEKKLVTIINGELRLEIVINRKVMQGIHEGESYESYDIELDVPAVIIDDRTYMPIRAIMEFFGADVSWDPDTRTVIITYDPPLNKAEAKGESTEGDANEPKEGDEESDSTEPGAEDKNAGLDGDVPVTEDKNTEPEGDDKDSSAKLPNPAEDVDSAEAFASLGFTLAPPEGAVNCDYLIIADSVAEIRFTYDGNDYVLRGADTTDDITGIYSELSEDYDICSVEHNGKITTIVTREIVMGGRLASWRWGELSFALYTADDVDGEDFAELCTLCGVSSAQN